MDAPGDAIHDVGGAEGIIHAPTAVRPEGQQLPQTQIQTGTVVAKGTNPFEDEDGKEKSAEAAPEGELQIVTIPPEEGGITRDFVFVNAHLRPPVGMGSKISLGSDAKMFFYKAGSIHIKELEALVAHGNQWVPGAATIILGDFNEGKWGKAVRALKAKVGPDNKKSKWPKGLRPNPACGGGWKDAVKFVKGSRVTWHWTIQGGLTLTNNYDHIFYKPDRLKLRECIIFDGFWDASDHLPVKAEFDIL
jgi:hypothetical protein